MTSDDERRATAYHEAGHFVIAWLNEIQSTSVSCEPDEEQGTAGRHRHCDPFEHISPGDIYAETPEARAKFEIVAMMLHAGLEAERRHLGTKEYLAGADSDMASLYEMVTHFANEDEAKPYLEWLRQRTITQLGAHWLHVEGVAQELVRRGTLTGDEAIAAARAAFDAAFESWTAARSAKAASDDTTSDTEPPTATEPREE